MSKHFPESIQEIIANRLDFALADLHKERDPAAFDMGAIGLDDNMKLLISEGVNGSHMVERLFWDFAGHSLLLPKNREHYPLELFVKWHQEQVFRR